ncbi:hypothetical protein SAMN05216279_10692 [Pseudomonas oryzihabitans]|uniref:Uncharacterized protein n=2 Tax=Pseudomonadaceae TaxID=135621 RepID=A0A1G5NIX9_9PSED|nr:hypothetical protein DFO60_3877 [Pseudomonas oleovorans]TCQ88611.1 hypothetical protein EC839_10595 [Pseudomonas sp. JUb52]SCZ37134.1 hypothetical protein SAMN05216279_10692 [Pseudomonas psychrotolerans]
MLPIAGGQGRGGTLVSGGYAARMDTVGRFWSSVRRLLP